MVANPKDKNLLEARCFSAPIDLKMPQIPSQERHSASRWSGSPLSDGDPTPPALADHFGYPPSDWRTTADPLLELILDGSIIFSGWVRRGRASRPRPVSFLLVITGQIPTLSRLMLMPWGHYSSSRVSLLHNLSPLVPRRMETVVFFSLVPEQFKKALFSPAR